MANKCVLGVCEVVDRVHAQLSDLAFEALRVSAGPAQITDTGLADGVWTAEINAGQGLRPAPATFTAER